MAELLGKPPLCEVVNNPGRYNNKDVRFYAAYETDGIERAVLLQKGCNRGITPYPPLDSKRHPTLDTLDGILASGNRGTADKAISGVFTSRFVWKGHRQLILYLDSVDKLKAETIQVPEAK
jgi:hypothetical protein